MSQLASLATLILAVLAALGIDRSTRRRGLDPPGFCFAPEDPPDRRTAPLIRRALAVAALATVLWIGVFGPLTAAGDEVAIDPSRLHPSQLFLLHLFLAGTLGLWFLLARGAPPGRPAAAPGFTWTAQLGFRTPLPLREIALGGAAGIVAWAAVLAVLLAAGLVLWYAGGEELLPEQPPGLIFWIAGLPASTRVLVSLSAGVVEETFFRGFLQPRIGIAASTGLFVLAHASYSQPMMLAGITLLSLVFALLVRWRQNIWPAIAAHALFDAVQLLVVIPTALELFSGGSPAAPIC